VGKSIRVTVQTTDALGGTTSLSSAAQTVANVEDEATGTVSISGTVQEGALISADITAVSDQDGAITATYQWQENLNGTWTDISGANSATLTIPEDQSYVGKSIRVTVQTTDALGGTTSLSSAAQTVANVDTVAPTFTSLTTVGVNENVAACTVVYIAVASDTDFNAPATANSISYSLKAGGDVGAFDIDATTGAVTIKGSPDFETKRSYTFTVLVTDAAGNAREQTVYLKVADVNEAANITGQLTGLVVESGVSGPGTPVISGVLISFDVDNPGGLFQPASGVASYGSWQTAINGQWTYSLNNGNPVVNALSFGQTLTDRFSVLTEDGTAQVVTITIQGDDEILVLPPVDPVPVVTTPTSDSGSSSTDADVQSDSVTSTSTTASSTSLSVSTAQPTNTTATVSTSNVSTDLTDTTAITVEFTQSVTSGISLTELSPVLMVAGESIVYQLPLSSLGLESAQSISSLVATQTDGAALPAWLTVDSQTGEVQGQVPADAPPSIEIEVVITDVDGNERRVRLVLQLGSNTQSEALPLPLPADALVNPEVSDAATTAPAESPSALMPGHPGLTEQIQLAQQGMLETALDLLEAWLEGEEDTVASEDEVVA
jgi:VCBS repeat-containing protein